MIRGYTENGSMWIGELCAGPCDAVPGIYIRLWRPPPEPPAAA